MTVTRIYESPRVTQPYTEEQWEEIDAARPRDRRGCGAATCALTMGGEPTFVSIDDPDGAEWNTDARSPAEARLAGELDPPAARPIRAGRAAALRPGQVVSRRTAAALGLRLLLAQGRRADLEDDALIADEAGLRPRWPTRSASSRSLAAQLDLPAAIARCPPTRTWDYLLERTAACRSTSTPLKMRLDESRGARPRSAKVFEQGSASLVGYVAAGPGGTAGATDRRWCERWWLRAAATLWLAPRRFADGLAPAAGFAPVGWSPTNYPSKSYRPRSVRARAQPLPPRAEIGCCATGSQGAVNAMLPPRRADQPPPPRSPDGSHRPLRRAARWAACTFSCRRSSAEDYLDLVAAIEDDGEDLRACRCISKAIAAVRSAPEQLKVTPDPGVIEVNMHPRKLGRTGGDHRRRSTRRRGRRGSARRNS